MVDDPKKRLEYKQPFYFRVKTVDVVNIKAVYTMMHEWFVEEEFCGDDDDFPEVYVRDRNSQKRGKEILVLWRLKKEPFGVTFYKRRFDVLIKMAGIKDMDIMQAGRKFRVQRGMLEIKVWSSLEYDSEMKWRNHWLLKYFLKIYVERLNTKEFDVHRWEVMRDSEAFQKAIKDYLNMVQHHDKQPDLKEVAGFENPYM